MPNSEMVHEGKMSPFLWLVTARIGCFLNGVTKVIRTLCMSQACGFDPNVAFAVTETPRVGQCLFSSAKESAWNSISFRPAPSMVSFKSSTLAVD